MTEVMPEVIEHLNQWGWAYLSHGASVGGELILQSPTGIRRIIFHMDENTVQGMRRAMMGIVNGH